jgi:hypothetical protein
MKAGVVVAVVAAALMLAAGASARTQRNVACTYKARGVPVYATLYGIDNTAANCRLFKGSWGARYYRTPPGSVRCVFVQNVVTVYVRVVSPSRSAGRHVCNSLDKMLTGWDRLR